MEAVIYVVFPGIWKKQKFQRQKYMSVKVNDSFTPS